MQFQTLTGIFYILWILDLAVIVRSCTARAPNGDEYSLEGAPKSIIATDSNLQWTYTVSLCASLIECPVAATCGYCQQNQNMQSYCVGEFIEMSAPLEDGTSGVILRYSGGDMSRSGVVKIRCNHQAFQPMNIFASEDRSLHGYVVSFDLAQACPRNSLHKPFSIGGIILILLSLCIVIYLSVGIGFNYQNGEQGAGLIPHLGFWLDVPNLIADGIIFSVNTVKIYMSRDQM